MATIVENLQSIVNSKAAIRSAIENKGVSVGDAPLADYATKIGQIEQGGGGGGYTGHVDEEGLMYIGWTDEDIAYFKQNICWSAEEDEDYKVTDYDKQKWESAEKTVVDGVTMCVGSAAFIKDAKMHYLPKTDTSSLKFSTSVGFANDYNLIATPSFSAIISTGLPAIFSACYNLLSFRISDVSGITSLASTFANCISIRRIDISNWDTKKVTDMGSMFSGCSNLETINFGDSFSTISATKFGSMFLNCKALETVDLSRFTTSSATTFSSMFAGCLKLKEIDVSHFETSSVTTFASMFNGCSSLQSIDVSKWDTPKATSFATMFENCSSIENLDISNFDTSNATIVTVLGSSPMPKLKSFRQKLSMEKCSSSGVFVNMNAPYASEDFDTVADVLRCLPTTTIINKTFTFAANSVVNDDASGTIMNLIKTVVAASWTIKNLTIA